MNYRKKDVGIKKKTFLVNVPDIKLVWFRTLKEIFERLLNKFPSKTKTHINCALKHSCNCYKTISKAFSIPTCVK